MVPIQPTRTTATCLLGFPPPLPITQRTSPARLPPDSKAAKPRHGCCTIPCHTIQAGAESESPLCCATGREAPDPKISIRGLANIYRWDYSSSVILSISTQVLISK